MLNWFYSEMVQQNDTSDSCDFCCLNCPGKSGNTPDYDHLWKGTKWLKLKISDALGKFFQWLGPVEAPFAKDTLLLKEGHFSLWEGHLKILFYKISYISPYQVYSLKLKGEGGQMFIKVIKHSLKVTSLKISIPTFQHEAPGPRFEPAASEVGSENCYTTEPPGGFVKPTQVL